MTDDEKPKLPTLGERLSEWLGVQLPSIPLPQTLKNLDKAIGKVVLAAGENVEARIKNRTGKIKVQGKIDVEGMYRTEEEKRKIENRANATKAAIEDLQQTSRQPDATKEIEDDWLNIYARLAEDKSSAELQNLFGRILAGEIRQPGSFSLRTLQILATMSKDDAERLSRLLSYVLENLVLPFENGERIGPSDRERLFLEEMGIAGHPVYIGGMAMKNSVPPKTNYLVRGSKLGILIENKSEKELLFDLPGQILTSSGRELLPIANCPAVPIDFLMKIAKQIRSEIKGKYSDAMQSDQIKLGIVTYRSEGQSHHFEPVCSIVGD